jgi:hypothetical protein
MSPWWWCFGHVHLETNKFNHKFHSTAANKSNANKTFTTPLTQDQGPGSHAACSHHFGVSRPWFFVQLREKADLWFATVKGAVVGYICDWSACDCLGNGAERRSRARANKRRARKQQLPHHQSRLFYRKSFVKSWLSASLSHNGSRPVLCTRRGEARPWTLTLRDAEKWDQHIESKNELFTSSASARRCRRSY